MIDRELEKEERRFEWQLKRKIEKIKKERLSIKPKRKRKLKQKSAFKLKDVEIPIF